MDYDDSPLYVRLVAAAKRILLSSSVTERAVFAALAAVALVSGLGLATMAADRLLVAAPRRGGALVEGVVGTPRFANPVLAASEADRDLSALVFSGLTRLGVGGIEPDLATYAVSEDGREYRFTIGEDARFHDGSAVTADDVVFTVGKTQDPELRSPRRGAWASVEVEKVGEREVMFRLKDAYPDFLAATTMGILPRSRFEKLSAQDFLYAPENVEPVGAGPFRVRRVLREGGATVGYELGPWESGAGAAPYLASLSLRFYPDEAALAEALRRNEVGSAYGLSPAAADSLAAEGFRVERHPLPRLYAVFFNQSHDPVLADRDVRAALDLAVDKPALVRAVLLGYGAPLDGPIPPAVSPPGVTPPAGQDTETPGVNSPAAARAALERDGFAPGEDGVLARKTKKGTERLALAVATRDAAELVAAANLVADAWRRAGAAVEVKVYPLADLTDTVIRERDYDALLFGEIVGRGADLYGFWHSSQRADPGLNVASYTSSRVDDLLTKARVESDPARRDELLASFAAEVEKDVPAVFLYAPEATYVLPRELSAPLPTLIATPAERFALARDWHEDTQRVWPVFASWR